MLIYSSHLLEGVSPYAASLLVETGNRAVEKFAGFADGNVLVREPAAVMLPL